MRFENGTSGKQASRSAVPRREVCGRGRTQPVVAARPVDPVVMRDRAADAGRDADAGAIRAQRDDGAGVVHARGRQERSAGRSRRCGRDARQRVANPARFSLKYRGRADKKERDHERAICAVSEPRRQGRVRHRRRLRHRRVHRRAFLRAAARRSRSSTSTRPPSTALCARIARRRVAARRASSAATCATSPRCRRSSGAWARRPAPITVLVNNAANDDRHKAMDVTLGLLERPHRGQPAPPVLRRAGRLSADEGGRRRIDRQFRLDQLDEQRGQLQRLHDVEGGGARHDARTRAGLGRRPHPRQHGRAGLGA